MEDFNTQGSKGLAEPPEGVIAGEDVPVENQRTEFEEQMIDDCVGMMKSKGEPYISMTRHQLEKKAVEVLDI